MLTQLLWVYKETATSLWIDSHLSNFGHHNQTEATNVDAACQSHFAQLWAYFSVPCSLLHVESSVEQWCLQRTCFLILHLVIFFLYFCWFNICINCKYIWFITVKPLVPVSGLPPWLILINTLYLGLESKVHAHVGKFSVLLSLHTYIWPWTSAVLGLMMSSPCGSPETKDQNWNCQWMTALIEEIGITLILILWDLGLKLTGYYDFYFVLAWALTSYHRLTLNW